MQLTEKKVIPVPTVPVSIPDANKAIMALRSYGLMEEQAIDVVTKETMVSIEDYKLIPRFSIAPYLIDAFGIDHINEAVESAYYFMSEYEINWESYFACLSALLDVYRAEELIANPEKIRLFLTNISFMISSKVLLAMRNTDDEEDKWAIKENIINSLLSDISSDDVERMANSYTQYE